MKRSAVVTLLCIFSVSLQVQDVSCSFWDKIAAEANRFGDRVSDNLSVLGGDIERGVKHVGQQIADEYERVEPRVKSWFEVEREVVVYRDNPVELQPRIAGATTCIGLPDDPSVILDCHFEGVSVNCSEPAQVGTVVNMGCDSGYRPAVSGFDVLRSITCNASYVWSNRLMHCIADCGRQNAVGGQEFISRGQDVHVGEFAWHVAIYQLNETQLFGQICGGSLITPGFVLTAAHCFWDLSDRKVREKELFRIAAGKYNVDWYIDDPEIQRRNISVIHMGERFAGDRHFLAYDIALVRLDHDIKLSPLVNIICIDSDNSLEALHLISGKNGTIAGWGITELNEPSEDLKSVKLPYIPVENCESIVETKFQKYLTHDKFCAGYRNKGISICPGDSGGGYAFPQETAVGRRFYVYGIASVGHRPRPNTGIKCQSQQVAAFTQVSMYMRWIKKVVRGEE